MMPSSEKSTSSLMDPMMLSTRRSRRKRKTKDGEIELEADVSLASAWNRFMKFTTSNGIVHIDLAEGKFKKMLWLLFTILCFVGLIINLYFLVKKYLDYNVDVLIKIEQAKAIMFPAVTICNNNPIRKSYFDENEDFKAMLRDYKNELLNRDCTAMVTAARRNIRSHSRGLTMATCFPTSGYTEDGRIQRSDFRLLNIIREKLITLDERQRFQAGHDIYDMIFDCEFSGGLCNLQEDFEYFFNSYYGNCFTFNSNRNDNETKASRRAGPRYGLSITFNVEQIEYVGEISQSAGLRVVVHDPTRMPFPEDDAILVAPSALTHIGLIMVRSEKLNGSYGDCYAEGLEKRTIYQEMYNLSYCEKGCQYTCLSREIVRKCSCVYAKFALTKNYTNRHLRPCSHDNETQRICVDSVWIAYENGNLICKPKCPVPCRETHFRASVSSDIWPSNSYLEYFNEFISLPTTNSTLEWENYGKFVVYIENLAYESISEYPQYEVHELLSDIGGILGLYIGFSLITLIEFVELFFDLGRVGIILVFRNIAKPRQNHSLSPNA